MPLGAYTGNAGNWWASTSTSGGTGVQVWDPSLGTWVEANSQRGRGIAAKAQSAQSKDMTDAVAGEKATKLAEIDTQEAEDTMTLNRQAAQNTNALAAMQTGRRRETGGGAFRQRGVNANSAIAGLSSANARNLATKRRAAVTTSLGTAAGKTGALANLTSLQQQVRTNQLPYKP